MSQIGPSSFSSVGSTASLTPDQAYKNIESHLGNTDTSWGDVKQVLRDNYPKLSFGARCSAWAKELTTSRADRSWSDWGKLLIGKISWLQAEKGSTRQSSLSSRNSDLPFGGIADRQNEQTLQDEEGSTRQDGIDELSEQEPAELAAARQEESAFDISPENLFVKKFEELDRNVQLKKEQFGDRSKEAEEARAKRKQHIDAHPQFNYLFVDAASPENQTGVREVASAIDKAGLGSQATQKATQQRQERFRPPVF